MDPARSYLDAALETVTRIRETQMEKIAQAAEICAQTIANDGLVHLFGTGHSRMFVEEMYPRHGKLPGVSSHCRTVTHVPQPGGWRQWPAAGDVSGAGRRLGAVILRNFVLSTPDSFIVFSNSGVNEVVVEVALEVKKLGLPLIAVVSVEHCRASNPRHSSGKRVTEIADVVIDNCSPAGDALVRVEGLADPVGPGSTVGGAAVTNAVKVRDCRATDCSRQTPDRPHEQRADRLGSLLSAV